MWCNSRLWSRLIEEPGILSPTVLHQRYFRTTPSQARSGCDWRCLETLEILETLVLAVWTLTGQCTDFSDCRDAFGNDRSIFNQFPTFSNLLSFTGWVWWGTILFVGPSGRPCYCN